METESLLPLTKLRALKRNSSVTVDRKRNCVYSQSFRKRKFIKRLTTCRIFNYMKYPLTYFNVEAKIFISIGCKNLQFVWKLVGCEPAYIFGHKGHCCCSVLLFCSNRRLDCANFLQCSFLGMN